MKPEYEDKNIDQLIGEIERMKGEKEKETILHDFFTKISNQKDIDLEIASKFTPQFWNELGKASWGETSVTPPILSPSIPCDLSYTPKQEPAKPAQEVQSNEEIKELNDFCEQHGINYEALMNTWTEFMKEAVSKVQEVQPSESERTDLIFSILKRTLQFQDNEMIHLTHELKEVASVIIRSLEYASQLPKSVSDESWQLKEKILTDFGVFFNNRSQIIISKSLIREYLTKDPY